MSILDRTVKISRRAMTLFFLIDTSTSMEGSKIGAVNDAVENVLPMISEISSENPDAEIRIAALEFSSGTRWLYDEPKPASDFVWQDAQADGRDGFEGSEQGCLRAADALYGLCREHQRDDRGEEAQAGTAEPHHRGGGHGEGDAAAYAYHVDEATEEKYPEGGGEGGDGCLARGAYAPSYNHKLYAK